MLACSNNPEIGWTENAIANIERTLDSLITRIKILKVTDKVGVLSAK